MSKSNQELSSLQVDMNSFGQLKWEISPLGTSTTFLNPNISLYPPSNTIIPHLSLEISMYTHQKPLNLYLYLPSHSVYPQEITKSLIYNLLQKYWQQNTYKSDFHHFTQSPFNRLAAQGHHPSLFHIFFLKAAANINQHKNASPTTHQR